MGVVPMTFQVPVGCSSHLAMGNGEQGHTTRFKWTVAPHLHNTELGVSVLELHVACKAGTNMEETGGIR